MATIAIVDVVSADIPDRPRADGVADREMAARLMAGDADALAAVYARYGGVVYGVCRRVLNDPRLAEDVTQEVFVSLWQHPERFDPSLGSLGTWLGLLARRRSIDRVRSEASRARRERAEPTNPVHHDRDDSLAAAWLGGLVRDALALLPDEQRQAVVLAYYGGRSYRQVAVELAIPEGTVKSRVRLALAKLNTILSSQLADQDTPAWT
jgi:RNA polymerase sigma-70 factor (ECF subfamily)